MLGFLVLFFFFEIMNLYSLCKHPIFPFHNLHLLAGHFHQCGSHNLEGKHLSSKSGRMSHNMPVVCKANSIQLATDLSQRPLLVPHYEVAITTAPCWVSSCTPTIHQSPVRTAKPACNVHGDWTHPPLQRDGLHTWVLEFPVSSYFFA
jgi:hypothetical protein